MFKRFAPLLVGGLLLASSPLHATTCAEGLEMLEATLRKVELNDQEFAIVTDLMFKAKVEASRGNVQKCVYIVGDIIKLVFLKTAGH